MATTSQYLQQLLKDREALVESLVTKGVNASNNETFTSLAQKVKTIKPRLQDKTVDPVEKGTNITFDDGTYEGLKTVTINPIKANMIEGLKPEIIKKGIEVLDIVGTYGATSQIKYVTPSQEQQIITPDSGIEFLSQVTIQPVTSAIDSDIISTNIKKGVEILGVEGTFEGDFAFQKKSVSANAEEDLVVVPDDGYDAIEELTVKKVTSSIDSYIRPENIKRGIEILGVTGTYAPDPSMADKYISPQTYEQEIRPDEGYSYFDKVTVGKVTSSIDSGIKSSNIREGVSILGVAGTLEPISGEEIFITPTKETQIITPNTEAGKNAITKATINPVTSEIDSKIIDTNIKKGVTILGVEGTFEGASTLQTKIATPTDSVQEISADSGYDALSNVTIEATPVEDITVNPSMASRTYTRSGDKFINSVTVNQVTSEVDPNIQPENIKQNMSILGVVGTYKGEQQNYFGALNTAGTSSLPGIVRALLSVPEDLVITKGNYMFYNCENLQEFPSLDYSSVAESQYMFYACKKITATKELSKFKNLTNANYMFHACSGLTSADLTNWTASKLQRCESMFRNCYNLTEIKLDGFTAPIYFMRDMFNNCSNLTKVDFSKANITTSYYFENMFQSCSKLIEADLSGIKSSAGSIACEHMFSGCRALQKLDIRNMHIDSLTSSSRYNDMFFQVPTSCEIIVMNDSCKTWFANKFSNYWNVKTVAEYEAAQGVSE